MEKMLLDVTWISKAASAIRNGNVSSALSNFQFEQTDTANAIIKKLHVQLQNILGDDFNAKHEASVCLAVSSLCLFIQAEWGADKWDEVSAKGIRSLLNSSYLEDASTHLLADGELLVPVKYPHLLLLSLVILESSHNRNKSEFWGKLWLLRALFIQQQVLDELSPQLYQKINDIINELEPLIPDGYSRIDMHLESARIHIYYGYVEKAGSDIAKAIDLAKLSINFTGALGKRTRHQQSDLPQLAVTIQVPENQLDCTEKNVKPRLVALDDDVRLEKISFVDKELVETGKLTSQHVSILLASLMHRIKSMPPDELTAEEHLTLVQKIIESNGNWCVQSSALLTRSHIEKCGRRTIERAMLQVQAILEEMQSDVPPFCERLNDFFVSFLPTKREVELTLADYYIALGAAKSALDVCLRLEQWEMAIECYNALQLRHKAKELIEQELNKMETPKLWCLLGDATDDEKCYETAWILSKEKSARAQRHWGNFLYQRKRYKDSIEHFRKSLDINSLQGNIWYRLGFAALHEEEWEISAHAYRRYCVLDNECFEAWNNLARCYCELKQKRRAWRALQEALKIDHSNWRVWDNYMLVSADLKELDEVVRSYHQILSIKTNHLDLLVLRSLVNCFLGLEVSEQHVIRKKIAELFGRITCHVLNEAELWVLYAEAYSNEETLESYKKQKDLLLKAHRSAVGKPGWERTWANCERVVAILDRLLTVTLLCNSTDGLSAIKLAASGSVSIITRCYPERDICTAIREKLAQIN